MIEGIRRLRTLNVDRSVTSEGEVEDVGQELGDEGARSRGSLRWGGDLSLELGRRRSPWAGGRKRGRIGRFGGLVGIEDILLIPSRFLSLLPAKSAEGGVDGKFAPNASLKKCLWRREC